MEFLQEAGGGSDLKENRRGYPLCIKKEPADIIRPTPRFIVNLVLFTEADFASEKSCK